jgi:hypothetical protein
MNFKLSELKGQIEPKHDLTKIEEYLAMTG